MPIKVFFRGFLKLSLSIGLALVVSFGAYYLSTEVLDVASLQLPELFFNPIFGKIMTALSPAGAAPSLPHLVLYSVKGLLLAGLVFLWCFLQLIKLLFGGTGISTSKASTDQEPVPDFPPSESQSTDSSSGGLGPADEKDLGPKERVLRVLAEEIRAGLMQLGLNMKCVLREAKSLALATGACREKVEALSDRNALLMGLIFQIDNFFSNSESDLPRLKLLFGQMKELVDEIAELDTAALDTFLSSQQATYEMNEYITKTTKDLLNEAKRVQKIKEKVFELKAAS